MGSLRSTSSNTASASTTCVVTKPAGTVQGDLLIAVIAKTSTGNPTATDWDICTTGGLIKNISQSTVMQNGCGMMWKVAGASEGASYTFTSTSAEWIVTIFCFQDINLTTLNSDNTPVEVVLFDIAMSVSRSGTTLILQDEPNASDWTHDRYWMVIGFSIQDAGVTHTLSSPSAYLTQVTNNALVGVAMLTAYAEIQPADNPELGPTQVTLGAGTGTGRGFALYISDPISEDRETKGPRARKTRPSRSRLVNA